MKNLNIIFLYVYVSSVNLNCPELITLYLDLFTSMKDERQPSTPTVLYYLIM